MFCLGSLLCLASALISVTPDSAWPPDGTALRFSAAASGTLLLAAAQLQPESGMDEADTSTMVVEAAGSQGAEPGPTQSKPDRPSAPQPATTTEGYGWIGVLVFVMLMAGVLGGVVSTVFELRTPAPAAPGLSPESETEGTTPQQIAAANILLGIAAALLTPLFLHFTSSQLVSDIVAGTNSEEGCLLFFGYCLIAAISARAFIRSLTSQVLRETQQQAAAAARAASEAEARAQAAEERAAAAQLIAEQAQELLIEDTEPVPPQTGVRALEAAADQAATSQRSTADFEFVAEEPTHELTSRVLQALATSTIPLRSATAVARELSASEADIERTLEELERAGAISRRQTAKGVRWQITAHGRRLAQG